MQVPSVAVLGFVNASGQADKAWLSTALAEMIGLDLGTGDRLRNIPGERAGQAVADLSLPLGPPLSGEALTRLRGATGTDLVVQGTYTLPAPGRVAVEAVLQDARDARVLGSVREEGEEADLLRLASRLGGGLRAALGQRGAAEGAAQGALPTGLEAARLYSEGLLRLRRFDAQGAQQLLEEASRADPRSPAVRGALALALAGLGQDARALAEARQALELGAELPLRERLPLEAHYRVAALDWDDAERAYRALFSTSGDIEHGLGLASAQLGAGKAREALTTLQELHALPPPASQDARIDLESSRAAAVLGDLPRAQELARAAAERARSEGARLLLAQARLAEADALRRQDKLDEAMAVFAETRRLFEAAGDRAGAARVLSQVSSALRYQGDVAGARAAAEEALRTARAIGHKGVAARALNTLAGLKSDEGRLSEARALYQESLALVAEVGDRDREAVTTTNLGAALWRQGMLGTARQALEESVALAQALGSKRREAFAVLFLGEILFDEGRLAEAREHYQRAIALAAPNAVPEAVLGLGKVLFEEDDLPGAQAQLDSAIRLQTDRGEMVFAARSQIARAAFLLEQGRAAAAEAQAREIVATLRRQGLAHLEGFALAVQAEALARQQKLAEARLAATRALALATPSEHRAVALGAALAAARVDALAGAPDPAHAALERTLVEARRAGLVVLQLEARLALGEVEQAQGRREAAARRLEELEGEAKRLGFRRLEERARRARPQ